MEDFLMKFNPVYIDATTLDDAWFKLLLACYEKGRKYLITDGSHAGEHRLALDDASGFIHYPHTIPLAPILPEGVPVPTTDDKIDQYFANYLMDNQLAEHEDYRYGTFIVGGSYHVPLLEFEARNAKMWGVFPEQVNQAIIVPNQVEWIIKHFKEKGFGNEHCFLTVGYPESNFAYDVPYENEMERKTSPCLRGLDFRIIEDKFFICEDCSKEHRNFVGTFNYYPCPFCKGNSYYQEKNYLLTKVIYRSWDLWGGFPENMGGFTLLNEYIANELGVEPGPLSFTSKSLHCYEHHTEVLKLRLGKGLNE
jgi:thymidylate synthase